MTDEELTHLFGIPSEKDTVPALRTRFLRCKCGRMIDVLLPSVCQCGESKPYWSMGGETLLLPKMSLGHLTNAIRFVGEKMESLPVDGREKFEAALDCLYAELALRDKEISQNNRILDALRRKQNGE